MAEHKIPASVYSALQFISLKEKDLPVLESILTITYYA